MANGHAQLRHPGQLAGDTRSLPRNHLQIETHVTFDQLTKVLPPQWVLQQRVATDDARYESSAKDKHTDVAVRWSQVLGDWDVGLSHFQGTSREPRLIVVPNDSENVLVPLYEQINQTGLDVQATKGAWLWKLESVWRSGQGDSFLAATAGFEYTFESVFESDLDVGVLLEYLYDERDIDIASGEPLSLVAFDNDLFFGMRLGFNDIQSTALLAGCVQDLDSSARFCNVEASRRFGDSWVLSLEARTFHSISTSHPLATQIAVEILHKGGNAMLDQSRGRRYLRWSDYLLCWLEHRNLEPTTTGWTFSCFSGTAAVTIF